MKYILLLFFACLILVNNSCNFKEKEDIKQISDDSWSTLTIVSEHRTVITFVNNNDTSIVKIHHIGSIFTPRPKKIIIDTIKAYFTKAEKDTLFNLAKEIVSHPVVNTRHCTDFVGDLDIFINYGDVRQQINYAGVCDWNTLSDRTMQLHNLLRKRIKNVFLGEGGSATSHVEN
jgi:hypothetical protein